MSSRPTTPDAKPQSVRLRPKYYDLNLFNLPVPGLVSIFHRVTGVVMFLFLIPLLLAALQGTLASGTSFATWQGYFSHPLAKLIVIGFVWSFMHHLFAGIRYLFLDLHIGVALAPARLSAKLVLVAGVVSTLIIAARIW